MTKVIEVSSNIFIVGSGQIGLSEEHDCHVYLINAGNDEWFIVDAGAGINTFELIENINCVIPEFAKPSHLFLTHAHADHMGGAADIEKRYDLQVFSGELASKRILSGDEQSTSFHFARRLGVYPSDYHLTPLAEVSVVGDGQIIQIANCEITVLETPGHSVDSISFLISFGDYKALFSGDSLFENGKLPLLNTFDSHLSDYRISLEKFSELEFSVLCPGHGLFMVQRANHVVKEMKAQLENSLYLPPVINS